MSANPTARPIPKLTPADPRPHTRRDAAVGRFVRERFGPLGTLRLHRAAIGFDLLRAPVNVMLSPVFLLVRLFGWLTAKLGLSRLSAWLAARRIFLVSDVSTVIAADMAELVEKLDKDGIGPAAPRDVSARAIADYAETRNAVAEITTSVIVMVSGLLLFHRATPGVISLAGPVAEMHSTSRAVGDFALGSGLGRMWYGAFPRELAMVEIILTGVVLAIIASVVTTFAGLIADPIQLWAGTHKRRIMRMLRRLDDTSKHAQSGGMGREHLLARAGDLGDVVMMILRSWR